MLLAVLLIVQPCVRLGVQLMIWNEENEGDDDKGEGTTD